MRLRSFTPADSDTVNAIALAAFEQYRGVYSDWDVLERGIAGMSALADTGEIIIAEDEDRIAGAVAYFGPNRFPRADFFRPEWAMVRMLVVDPAERGKGAGRRLTEACIERARGDRAEAIALHTSPVMEVALAMYLRMGFRLEKRVPDRFGVPYAVYLMRLD